MYALASNKEAKVTDCWGQNGKGDGWNIQLRRRLNDWEVVQMSRLLGLVEASIIWRDSEDLRRLSVGRNCSFQ